MRVKNSVATRRRRKRVLKQAEGSWGSRNTLFKTAKQTIIRSGEYSFRDRRVKKRDFRKLWISRLSAALRAENTTYSKFMHELKLTNNNINRKMLSEMAIHHPEQFKTFVKNVQDQASSQRS